MRAKAWLVAALSAITFIGTFIGLGMSAATAAPPTTSNTGTPNSGTSNTGTSNTGTSNTGTSNSGTSNTAPKHSVTPLCATPAPGHARCFALAMDGVNGGIGIRPRADTPSGYGPADLAAAYGLPTDGGAGATVAIVDAYDNPNAEADLAVYRQQYGLPACTTDNGCFRKIDQRGGTDYPDPDAGWAGEMALDLDMVSAVAPNAHILLVEGDDADFTNLGAAVNQAVAEGAKYVSNSYGTGYTATPGSGEDPSFPTEMAAYYNHPGVAMVASSGDDDYGVSWPAASQYVTSVGGTSLVKDDSARGWSESVWHNSYGGPGSGCSLYETKPAFQTDTGCDKRTVADVSAVADPETGVAIYNTYQAEGWAQYGGTSASSPIIAGIYAGAGTPAVDSRPNSFPYLTPSAFNDVTAGANGTCDPAYLCTAGPGFDGPTGLGTPKGLTGFRGGPHGTITGTITDSGSDDPIAGATVSTGEATATTDEDGTYTLSVPAGTVDLDATAYGYATASADDVAVADGATVTEDFALDPVPSVALSGAITDGSGHHWPLSASITIDGVPGDPIATDPYTGRYSVDLPENATYRLHVNANYPGYQPTAVSVKVGQADLQRNISVPIDAFAGTAPGYTYSVSGTAQTFDGTSAPAGWSVKDNTGDGGWVFDDPGGRTNLTGGDGGFAIIDSDTLGTDATQDTELLSPVTDFTGKNRPEVSFDTDYKGYDNSVAAVDVTVDGGTTWDTVWSQSSDSVAGPAHVDIPLPQAAKQKAAQVRFHYTGAFSYWWELDNVRLGNRSVTIVPGGLVAGTVTDANTGDGVPGATITSTDKPAEVASSGSDGFYWMFSSLTGAHEFTAAKAKYASADASVPVAANYVTRSDFSLSAGQLSTSVTSIKKAVGWGGSATAKVKITNTGDEPATATLTEQPGDFQILARKGAPKFSVRTQVTKHSAAAAKGKAAKAATGPAAGDADDAWTPIADHPAPVQDNAVGFFDGKVYSADGFDGSADVAQLHVFDPDAGSWSELTAPSETRETPAYGFLSGKFVLAGGWGSTGDPTPSVEIYDPGSDSWSTGADMPTAYAGAGSATLDGKLYVIGGCTDTCGSTDVQVYDPAADSWSSAADYPEPMAWSSCAGISGEIYCAGGTTDDAATTHAYVYDPAADSWSPLPDLPTDVWGSAYTGANGKLLISGGVAGGDLSNTGYAFDPAASTWSSLPNADDAFYRAGGALGFYRIGGGTGSLSPPIATAEVLTGYDQGENVDVSWLSGRPAKVTLAPGKSATVTVAVDASVQEITQPGVYTAQLGFQTDTPYAVPPIDVTMTVKPPATWGKISGTVQGTGPDGTAPLPGATVQIDTWAGSYTLKTGTDGSYALWLDVRNNPLQLIVAKDGFQPQTRKVTLKKGATVTGDFTLKSS